MLLLVCFFLIIIIVVYLLVFFQARAVFFCLFGLKKEGFAAQSREWQTEAQGETLSSSQQIDLWGIQTNLAGQQP